MSQDNPTNKTPHRPMFDQDGAGGQRDNADPARRVYRAAPSGGAPVRESVSRQARPSHTDGAAQAPRNAEEQKRKKKVRRKRRTIRGATIALSLIALLVVGAYAGYTTVFDHLRGEDTDAGSLPEAIKTAAIPEYTGKNIISGLICGIDYDLDASGVPVEPQIGRTDLILYLMYNTETNQANILQIPRDTYVGTELATGGEGKINGLYFNSTDPDNRMQALAGMVYDQLKLPVDFYLALDMDAILEMVYCLGHPLRVYVPKDIEYVPEDRSQPASRILQGWRDFDKTNIEFFLRSRDYNDADIGRLAAQQYFYAALFRELKTMGPADMVRWMTIIIYYANIGGIGAGDIMGLGQEVLSLESENILFVRPPITGADRTNSITGKPVSLVSLVPDETADLLNQYFRPDGHVVPVEELGIQTLPMNYIGKSEASIITMSGIEETEGT